MLKKTWCFSLIHSYISKMHIVVVVPWITPGNGRGDGESGQPRIMPLMWIYCPGQRPHLISYIQLWPIDRSLCNEKMFCSIIHSLQIFFWIQPLLMFCPANPSGEGPLRSLSPPPLSRQGSSVELVQRAPSLSCYTLCLHLCSLYASASHLCVVFSKSALTV